MYFWIIKVLFNKIGKCKYLVYIFNILQIYQRNYEEYQHNLII